MTRPTLPLTQAAKLKRQRELQAAQELDGAAGVLGWIEGLAAEVHSMRIVAAMRRAQAVLRREASKHKKGKAGR